MNLLVKIAEQIRKHPVLFSIFLLAMGALLLFLRRPDALLNPQFWAEDGKYWYADAYNDGPIKSIFQPYSGSLQVAMRLVANVALIAPFRYAPALFTIIALTLKLLPVILLMTKRFSTLIPNTKARLLIIFFYLLIPSGYEIHANLTNINWHLTLLAFMVLVAKQPSSRLWGIFDFGMIILSGLTGPFSIILSGIALLNYRHTKNRRNLWLFATLTACALLQVLVLVIGPEGARTNQPLGVSLTLLLKIIGSRIGTATIWGSSLSTKLVSPESWMNAIAGILVIAITVFTYLKAALNLRLFIMLTWLMFAAARVKPLASDTIPQWYALLIGSGARYFFFPILCFFICLVFIAFSRHIPSGLRIMAAVLIAFTFLISLPAEFRYPERPNLSFDYFEREFRKAPRGQVYCLPINPGWDMCLDKH